MGEIHTTNLSLRSLGAVEQRDGRSSWTQKDGAQQWVREMLPPIRD